MLNSNAKDLTDKKQFWDDMTQLASFSKEGLPMQVLSFLGAGSLAELYKLLSPTSPLNPITQSMQNIPSNFFATLSLSNFLLAGAIGVVVVTAVLRVIGNIYLNNQKGRIQKVQVNYYNDQFKGQMRDSLFNFYNDIKELVKTYFPNYEKSRMYKNDIMEWSDDQVKELIYNKILPPNNLNWSVWESPKTDGGKS